MAASLFITDVSLDLGVSVVILEGAICVQIGVVFGWGGERNDLG